jgi:hypothetical protein
MYSKRLPIGQLFISQNLFSKKRVFICDKNYLSRRTINGLLGGSDGVNGGHQTLNDFEVVVDDLGKGSQAVGGARGVGDDLHAGVVGLQVDTDHEHGGISAGSGDDDLLGTALQVSRGLLDGGEHTSGLNDVLGAGLAPGDVLRVTFLDKKYNLDFK